MEEPGQLERRAEEVLRCAKDSTGDALRCGEVDERKGGRDFASIGNGCVPRGHDAQQPSHLLETTPLSALTDTCSVRKVSAHAARSRGGDPK